MSHPTINLPSWLLKEKIERAAKAFQVSPSKVLEKLFLVVPVPFKGQEGDTKIETEYGKLLVFFVFELCEFQKYGKQKPTALLLSKHKFDYPKVSTPSTRAFKDINEVKSHLVN